MRDAETVAGMPCPTCKTGLAMSERHGIEIDYCPNCRGIWLDRGELDKIIERSAAADAPTPLTPPPAPQASYPTGGAGPWDQGSGGYGRHSPYPKKRRKSFLEELFD